MPRTSVLSARVGTVLAQGWSECWNVSTKIKMASSMPTNVQKHARRGKSSVQNANVPKPSEMQNQQRAKPTKTPNTARRIGARGSAPIPIAVDIAVARPLAVEEAQEGVAGMPGTTIAVAIRGGAMPGAVPVGEDMALAVRPLVAPVGVVMAGDALHGADLAVASGRR